MSGKRQKGEEYEENSSKRIKYSTIKIEKVYGVGGNFWSYGIRTIHPLIVEYLKFNVLPSYDDHELMTDRRKREKKFLACYFMSMNCPVPVIHSVVENYRNSVMLYGVVNIAVIEKIRYSIGIIYYSHRNTRRIYQFNSDEEYRRSNLSRLFDLLDTKLALGNLISNIKNNNDNILTIICEVMREYIIDKEGWRQPMPGDMDTEAKILQVSVTSVE